MQPDGGDGFETVLGVALREGRGSEATPTRRAHPQLGCIGAPRHRPASADHDSCSGGLPAGTQVATSRLLLHGRQDQTVDHRTVR